MTEEHQHEMYVTGYSADGRTMYRRCYHCDHTDSVSVPKS